jgi:hypothetical protein
MLWTDVDPAHEAEFDRWCETEHLARLRAVPGVLSAGRYVAVKGGPRHLAMHELEGPQVLRTPACLDAARAAPAVGRNYLSNGYRQIFPARTSPVEQAIEPPPCLQMGRIDIPAHLEEEFNDWYDTVYIPGYLAVPGVLRARRFVAIDGQPKYLTVYELESPQVPESDAWKTARESNPWSARIRRFMRLDPGSPGVFRRKSPA